MDNQPLKIQGYRNLTQDEILVINNIKSHGKVLQELCLLVEKIEDIDKRWLSIARTHFQEGLMALTRSVARPDSF